MAKPRFAVWIAVAALLWGAAPASAQQGGELQGGDRPWARGISEEKQKAALELFKEGNELLKESVFVQAADRYRKALQHWDHPAIHYNLAFCLLNLDQPVLVYEHLEKAMHYGPAPLEQEKFELAKSYKALVEKQLARIEISCEEPDAMVTMDGTPLFKAPGKYAGLVRAGPHTVLASKEGFITAEDTRNLPAGQITRVELKLKKGGVVLYKRRWAAWKPWAVTGGGVLILAAGAFFNVTAASAFKDFDMGIEECGGCVPMGDLADKRSTGETMRTLSIISYSFGGAALITGAVLLYVNRARPYTPGGAKDEGEEGVSLVPVIGPNDVGVSATIRF